MVSGIILGIAFVLIFALPFAFGDLLGDFIRDLLFLVIFAVICGGILGLADGLINGVVLVMHAACFAPDRRASHLYRWSALVLALICTASTTFLIMRDLFHFYGIMNQVTVIATLAVAFLVWRLASINTHKSA